MNGSMYLDGELVHNPYRKGSKMASVFHLFSDGCFHHPRDLVHIVKSAESVSTPANRRTATSFIRTLRRKFQVSANKYSDGTFYRIVGRA